MAKLSDLWTPLSVQGFNCVKFIVWKVKKVITLEI